jgi:hypothetical protein
VANEILLSGIGDLTVASAISAEYLLLLADRNALPNHPALMYAGSIDGRGSNVIKVPHIGLMGYDSMSQTADGSAVANTALSDGSTTITVVRQSKAYEASDLSRIVSGDKINPVAFAQDAVQASALRLTDLICDVIDGFSSTAGSTGVDLDTAVVLAAIGAVRVANVPGPYMGVLHGQQWSDFILDAGLAAGGAIQMMGATQDMLILRGDGYQGAYLGVDWFISNRVVTANAGADRAGAIFGRGGVLWGDGTPPLDDSAKQMVIGGKVLFEQSRDAASGLVQYVSHQYVGVSKGLEAGVSVITDA